MVVNLTPTMASLVGDGGLLSEIARRGKAEYDNAAKWQKRFNKAARRINLKNEISRIVANEIITKEELNRDE